MAPYVRRNARRPEHVTFLQEVCFSPPDRRVEINPDYRPASPIGTIGKSLSQSKQPLVPHSRLVHHQFVLGVKANTSVIPLQ